MGPNGSGKSNVIDAMLFVFGYRAQKIRSKKVSVLIHNSEHHQDVQNCSVTVYFQKIVDLVCEVDGLVVDDWRVEGVETGWERGVVAASYWVNK